MAFGLHLLQLYIYCSLLKLGGVFLLGYQGLFFLQGFCLGEVFLPFFLSERQPMARDILPVLISLSNCLTSFFYLTLLLLWMPNLESFCFSENFAL